MPFDPQQVTQFVARLSQLGCEPVSTAAGFKARCPCPNHADHNPSLAIFKGLDGRWLVQCKAGCEYQAIMSAVESGIHKNGKAATVKRIITPTPQVKKIPIKPKAKVKKSRGFASLQALIDNVNRGQPQVWTYVDKDNAPVIAAVRWNKPNGQKEMRQASLDYDGLWYWQGVEGDIPPLNLPDILAAHPDQIVYVVEGEKCVDAMTEMGLLATTNCGGSNAAKKTDWSCLGGRNVVILPDNDIPGRKHANGLASILNALEVKPRHLQVIQLPNLGEGGDVADWSARYVNIPDNELRKRLLDLIAQQQDVLRHTLPPPLFCDPFPEHAFPYHVQNLINDIAAENMVVESFVALPLLAIAGGAIGNSCTVKFRGYECIPVVWGIILGEPGANKSDAMSWLMKPIRTRDADEKARFIERYNEWASEKPLNPATKPKHCKTTLEDVTIEKVADMLQANERGLIAHHDEIANWFASHKRYTGEGQEAKWIGLWNGSHLSVDRKGQDISIDLDRPMVSLFGSSQPKIFVDLLTKQVRHSGLLSRFLLVENLKNPQKYGRNGYSAQSTSCWKTVCRRLFSLHSDERQQLVFELSPEAEEVMQKWFAENQRMMHGVTDERSAALSKLEYYAGRFLLIIHCLTWACNGPYVILSPSGLPTEEEGGDIIDDDWYDSPIPAPLITEQTAERTVSLLRWFAKEQLRVYDLLDNIQIDSSDILRRVANWMNFNDGRCTVLDLVDNFERFRHDMDYAGEVIQQLIQRGYAEYRNDEFGASYVYLKDIYRRQIGKPEAISMEGEAFTNYNEQP